MSNFLRHSKDLEEKDFYELDFEDMIRLPEGGSICEIFRTRRQRREVFVKRLKKEYRTNPLYLDALDKEYEIGVRLKHPSLPDYREFHHDYIVMDFIDGDTLATLIENKDPWLQNERNIIRLLRELVEVVGYLHRHHVTHCDIKPDNIMLTSNNHNLVLIDFDKCYTDFLNDTSGDPSKYGLTYKEEGSTAIDFNGIERTIRQLKEKVPGFKFKRYNKFVRICKERNCNSERLLEILDYNPTSFIGKYKPYLIAISCFVLISLGFLWFLFQERSKNANEVAEVIPQTKPEEKGDVTEEELLPVNTNSNKGETSIIQGEENVPLNEDLKSKFNKSIQPYFDDLNEEIESLVAFSHKPGITGEQLLERILKYEDKAGEYFSEILLITDKTFPNLSETKTWNVVASSQLYRDYEMHADPALWNLGLKVKELANNSQINYKNNQKQKNLNVKTKEQIYQAARLMAEDLDKRIKPYFDELNSGIDTLVAFSNNPEITGEQLLEQIRKHIDKEDEYISKSFDILDETFPKQMDKESMLVISFSQSYTGYKRRSEPILRKLAMKVEELGY